MVAHCPISNIQLWDWDYTPTDKQATVYKNVYSAPQEVYRQPPSPRPSSQHYTGSLTVAGIKDASPKKLFRKVSTLKDQRVEGSAPKKRIPDQAMYQSKTEPVEGSQPMPKDVIVQPRDTCPLNPVYTLPSYKDQEAHTPREVRGQKGTSNEDIEGSRPLPAVPHVRGHELAVRDLHLDTTDIPGSKLGYRPTHRAHCGTPGHIRDHSLTVSDIPGAEVTKNFTFEAPPKPEVPGSTTTVFHPRTDQPNINLTNTDIQYAQARTNPDPFHKRVAERRHFRQTNNVRDIRGSASKPSPAYIRKPTIPNSVVQQQAGEQRQQAQGEAKEIMTSMLGGPRKDVQQMWNAFKRCDREGIGKVTKSELAKVLTSLQVSCAAEKLNTLVLAFDTDKSGYFNYKQFTKEALPLYDKDLPRSPVPPPSPPSGPSPAGRRLSMEQHGTLICGSEKFGQWAQPTPGVAAPERRVRPSTAAPSRRDAINPITGSAQVPKTAPGPRAASARTHSEQERSQGQPSPAKHVGWKVNVEADTNAARNVIVNSDEVDHGYRMSWMPTKDLNKLPGSVHGASSGRLVLDVQTPGAVLLQSSNVGGPQSKGLRPTRPQSAAVGSVHYTKMSMGKVEREHRQLAEDIRMIRNL